jgi:predicted transcriptional regulator
VIEMAKNAPQALSEAQQEIMEIIWDREEVSVSEVREVLQERRDVARNTVQTMIVRIEQKGWIEHRSIGRTFVYKAIQPRTTTLRQRLDDLMTAAGRGSAEALVTALLEDVSLTTDAADRIRDMIDEAEQRTKKNKKGNR